MIKLASGEKVILVLHRHWILMFQKLLVAVFLVILPLIAFPMIKSFLLQYDTFDTSVLTPFLAFFLIIYFMLITLYVFIAWVDYYLDTWIITNQRIIDIEQQGLFSRSVSEFMLGRVQDITINVPNLTATMFKYGDINIQTAGEKSFSIKQIPNIYDVKEAITNQCKKQGGHVRSL
jgi:hypothetical protein